jgi:subtilisin family serine protease
MDKYFPGGYPARSVIQTAVRGGVWQLLLRNPSPLTGAALVDVWTLDDQNAPEVVFSGTSVRDSMKIGSPGSASQAITVASFTTKVVWTDIQGQPGEVGLALNDISDFSSEGPLRNNAQKPDIAAPGAMIVSALSSHSSPRQAEMINNNFLVMAGTSMATPFVTGLVALLLERDPTLDPAGVKQLLQSNAAIPGRPAGTFDPKWGHGLIDALNL